MGTGRASSTPGERDDTAWQEYVDERIGRKGKDEALWLWTRLLMHEARGLRTSRATGMDRLALRMTQEAEAYPATTERKRRKVRKSTLRSPARLEAYLVAWQTAIRWEGAGAPGERGRVEGKTMVRLRNAPRDEIWWGEHRKQNGGNETARTRGIGIGKPPSGQAGRRTRGGVKQMDMTVLKGLIEAAEESQAMGEGGPTVADVLATPGRICLPGKRGAGKEGWRRQSAWSPVASVSHGRDEEEAAPQRVGGDAPMSSRKELNEKGENDRAVRNESWQRRLCQGCRNEGSRLSAHQTSSSCKIARWRN